MGQKSRRSAKWIELMYFDSVSEAISMAGHGGYVWSAYLITIVVVVLMLVLPRRREKQFFRELGNAAKRQQREEN